MSKLPMTLVLLVTSACGGGDLISRYVDARRGEGVRQTDCGTNAGPDFARYTGFPFLVLTGDEVRALEKGLRDRSLKLDARLAETCISRHAAATSCWGPQSTGFVAIPECDSALTGKAEGAACTGDLECAGRCYGDNCAKTCSGSHKIDQSACTTNATCGGSPFGCIDGVCRGALAQGESCQALMDWCGPGLYCSSADGLGKTDVAGTCLPRAALGEACSQIHWYNQIGPASSCLGHLICAGIRFPAGSNVPSQAGVCAVPRELGQSCQHDFNFLGGVSEVGDCRGGLFCDGGACRALPEAGKACHHGVCGPGSYCAANDVCAAKPRNGQACSVNAYWSCLDPDATCDQGTCKVVSACAG